MLCADPLSIEAFLFGFAPSWKRFRGLTGYLLNSTSAAQETDNQGDEVELKGKLGSWQRNWETGKGNREEKPYLNLMHRACYFNGETCGNISQ